MPKSNGDPVDRQFRSFIESTYNPIPRDDQEKIIDGILTLVEMGHDRKQSVKSCMDFAIKMVFKFFDFHEIVVGLKSRTDDSYRYEYIFGFRKDLEANMRKLRYVYDDMVNNDKFPYIKTGRFSELNPAEGLPESERSWYKPYALSSTRKSPDDFHEGDYIDVWMFSKDKTLIGWFEIGNPMNGKLPTRTQLRWIELIATVCSSVLTEKWGDEDQTRPTVLRTSNPEN